MLKKTLTATALALGATIMIAAPASAVPGYSTDRLDVKAGPDYDYPTVAYARSGSRIEINGCLRDWSWCDVTTHRGRGWVLGEDLQAERAGRRISYGAPWGVANVTFSIGNYWDNHYKGRSFYGDRDNWSRRGGKSNGHGRNDHDGRDRDGDGRDRDRDHPKR
ncbi:SH3 domain-containing protein [Emcibacter sp. SYSU 3D8]|uniref:SH3 domain-containing protein n=1 Tax=Emcibacter sp. SYSU 3D8 TaxID=3133969 RepID=UPI0031FF19AD